MKSPIQHKRKDGSISSTTFRPFGGYSFRTDAVSGDMVGAIMKSGPFSTHTDGQFKPKKFGIKNPWGDTNYYSARTGRMLQKKK